METTHRIAEYLRQKRAAQVAPVAPTDLTSTLTETRDVTTASGTVRVVLHWPHLQAATGMVINLHGGGFIYPHTDRDTLFCKQLCLAANVLVCDILYPLAPEHPFPAPLQACYEVVQALQDRYQQQLGWPTLLGHGAGGNLAVGTQILAQRRGQPVAQHLLLVNPLLDLSTAPEDKISPTGVWTSGTVDLTQDFTDFYLPGGAHQNILLSPSAATPADLVNFPPTFILSADRDPLCAEAETFAQHLVATGTRVTTRRYQQSPHGFLVDHTGAYKQAFHDISHQLKA